MAKYKTILDLVGNTPLVQAVNYEMANELQATLLVKLEYFNPAGSVKDRVAKAIIEDAEKREFSKRAILLSNRRAVIPE